MLPTDEQLADVAILLSTFGAEVSGPQAQEIAGEYLDEIERFEKERAAAFDGIVERANAELDAKDARIAELEAQLSALTTLQSSDSWELIRCSENWPTDLYQCRVCGAQKWSQDTPGRCGGAP